MAKATLQQQHLTSLGHQKPPHKHQLRKLHLAVGPWLMGVGEGGR